MNARRPAATTPASAPHGAFLALIGLFVGSGAAALIYEVVWFQLLELVIGASSVSLGVLLGTFMGGMCIGSLLLPRLVSRRQHPLRVYAALEAGIGVIGVAVLFGMPLIGSVYAAWAGEGFGGMVFRAIIAGACLLPPTILMGATLPAIARWVETTPQGMSWLGFFYGGNIAGAVIGSLLAGFYLLRIYDVAVATLAAAALNLLVAGLAWVLAAHAPHAAADAPPPLEWRRAAWPVYLTLAVSGLTALGAQVVWTRHLSLLFGATVYTFALILAVFLFGLGVGSSAGAVLARSIASPRLALGGCQLLLCAAMAWSAYVIAESLPFWPLTVTQINDPWIGLQLDLVRALWAMLPATLLWGASFPLGLAAAAAPGQDPGRLVGGLYAANTVGAIVGALGVSLVLVVWIGSERTQELLIVLAAISGLLAWTPVGTDAGKPMPFRPDTAAFAVVVVLLVAMLAPGVQPLPGEFVAYGRFLPVRNPPPEVIYVGEGLTASVAVTVEGNGIMNYHNAGKVQASSYPQDMRLQRMLGHLTTLLPENPESMLVIGLGAGVTAGAVSISPDVQRVTIAEIEPLVPEVVSTYFGRENYDVVTSPKVDMRIDDGRHFLLTTRQKFDGITSDPLDPWVKGAAMLYTEEFWELVKSRLNPGGVVTVFVQLYESTEEAVKSEVGTFLRVFPNGAIFANTVFGQGYDVVLVGLAEDDATISVDRVADRLDDPRYVEVVRSLNEVQFYSGVELLSTFAGQASDLAPWLADAAINRDRNLRLQYLAGAGLNRYQAASIFNNMVAAGLTFPETLFSGSEERMAELRTQIEMRQGRF